MQYNDEFLKKMVQVGTLGYPFSKIINVFDIDNENEFQKDFDNPKHEVAKHYAKGKDKADFVLDSKLFEMAKMGDLKALEKYEQRKRSSIYREEREYKQRN
jgi:hypothetical protein